MNNIETTTAGSIGCRVGAGLAPDAPHRPVREVFPHTVRQSWSCVQEPAVAANRRRMTVAAHQNA